MNKQIAELVKNIKKFKKKFKIKIIFLLMKKKKLKQ